ncbi:hypothetical protein [Ferrimicrobium sp.]|nr:hypothetical protein [Ferrimicrobium sp.]
MSKPEITPLNWIGGAKGLVVLDEVELVLVVPVVEVVLVVGDIEDM